MTGNLIVQIFCCTMTVKNLWKMGNVWILIGYSLYSKYSVVNLQYLMLLSTRFLIITKGQECKYEGQCV